MSTVAMNQAPKQRRHFINGKWRHLQGVRRSSPNRPPRAQLAPPSAALPTRSDDNAGKLALEVEDQETVGCCTGEGVTSAMEAAIFITTGIRVQLACLFLYFWTRFFEGTPPDEDSGCEVADVVHVSCDRGCALASSWPFVADKFSEQPPAELDQEAAQYRVLLDFECPTDAQTKHSLIQGFPVVCAFDVPNAMMSEETATTGLVAHTTPDDYAGRHCVLILDYDDEKQIHGDRGGYLCLNSWGRGWGLDGLFWISYACAPSERFTYRRVGVA